MFRKTMLSLAAATGIMAVAVPASAQQSGLVNVYITDVNVLNNVLNDAQIAALNNLSVPIVVQAPIGVAAQVCGVSAAVLGAAGSAGQCNATTGSQAFANLLNRQGLI